MYEDETLCALCEEPIEHADTHTYEIRRCIEANGDHCPSLDHGFFHTGCLQNFQEEPAEE